MKKSLLAGWLLLILVASILSGCLFPVFEVEGDGRGGPRGGHDSGRDRGHGDRGR